MSKEPIIELKKASIFQRDNLILANVNLSISEGEFVYLIGKTGSGKSSLLRTLYGELPARDGEVEVAGYDLTQIKRKDIPYLRRKIGIVFQDFQLLHDRTVEKNLEFVLGATGWTDKEEISERIDEVLNEVGLKDKRQSMPHQLSGGEQQSIAIARALLNEPLIILADEPTGNLDPVRSLELMLLLEKINEMGTTILVVTHEKELVNAFSKRVIAIDGGHLISDGMDGYYSYEIE